MINHRVHDVVEDAVLFQTRLSRQGSSELILYDGELVHEHLDNHLAVFFTLLHAHQSYLPSAVRMPMMHTYHDRIIRTRAHITAPAQ